ncbi:MAG: transglutaminase-like domain-containing protein [Planctomycetota bacterium]|jgi:transglutaminase-like putative cysteine protease
MRYALPLLLILPALAGERDSASVTLRLAYTITPERTSSEVVLTVAIPQTLKPSQEVVAIEYSKKPKEVFTEQGTRYARFRFPYLRETQEITIEARVKCHRLDLKSVEGVGRKGGKEKRSTLKAALAPEVLIEVHAPGIQKAAARIRGKTSKETLKRIMEFVTGHMQKTDYDDDDHGALWALKRGKGDCTEYADLFVALCRAKGIPARYCEGYMTYMPAGDTPKHNWAEAYLKGRGWIFFDPLHVDLGKARFDRLKPYLLLSRQRRDPVLNNHHYYRYRYGSGKVTVRERAVITPEGR